MTPKNRSTDSELWERVMGRDAPPQQMSEADIRDYIQVAYPGEDRPSEDDIEKLITQYS